MSSNNSNANLIGSDPLSNAASSTYTCKCCGEATSIEETMNLPFNGVEGEGLIHYRFCYDCFLDETICNDDGEPIQVQYNPDGTIASTWVDENGKSIYSYKEYPGQYTTCELIKID